MPTYRTAANYFVSTPPPGPLIDWHCHILPGLDDGAESLAEALEMARILAGAGFAGVYCTPHCVRGRYENTPRIVRRAVAELQTSIDRAGIILRLHAGMEYYLDEYFVQQLSDPLPLGDSNCLLVEASTQADPEWMKKQMSAIRRSGYIPLVAHPERSDFFAGRKLRKSKGLLGKLKSRFSPVVMAPNPTPGPMQDLRAMGCLLQGNLGSFSGIYGPEVKKLAEQFFTAGDYFCFGSDAHRENSLEKMLTKGLAWVRRETPEP
jgi:protein-tyrosine phosphatase